MYLLAHLRALMTVLTSSTKRRLAGPVAVSRSPKGANPDLRFLMISNSSSHQTTARLTAVLSDRLREKGHPTQLQLRALPRGIVPKLRSLLVSELQNIALIRRADVVVVHTPLALSLLTLFSARLLRRSVLSFIWDLHPESNRLIGTMRNPLLLRLFWLLERLGLFLSSRLLISTEDYRPFLGPLGRKARVVPIWPCDPVTQVGSPPEDRDVDTLRIGFAGQINSIRGLAEGISKVLDSWQGTKVELHLFSGDACPEPLVRRASCDPRLVIVEYGFVDPVQLQQHLAELDLGWVCLDSSFRLPAFPSKIMAYLCAGLPVLYTGPALPALCCWLATHQLGIATAPGRVLGELEIADLRRDFESRRAAYFAEMQDQWSSLGHLL
jgi:hypothetical protein